MYPTIRRSGLLADFRPIFALPHGAWAALVLACLENPSAGTRLVAQQCPAVHASARFRRQSAVRWKRSGAPAKPYFGAPPGLGGSRLACLHDSRGTVWRKISITRL